MIYLLSDFFGLWQAMQFCTRIGATSLRKLTGAGSSARAGGGEAGDQDRREDRSEGVHRGGTPERGGFGMSDRERGGLVHGAGTTFTASGVAGVG